MLRVPLSRLLDGTHRDRARCVPATSSHGVFACTRKDRLIARTGSPYLALELRDRTRRHRRPARSATPTCSPGASSAATSSASRGRVERFRDELQVEVRAIARARRRRPIPPPSCPSRYRDLDELDGFLEHLAGEVHDPGFAALLAALLGDDALRAALRRAPCTRAGHHAYLGGLLEHTVAVGTLAVETCALHPRLDQDLLLTAALVHDLGAHARVHATAPRSASPTRAGCSATSSSALRLLGQRGRGDRPRRRAPARRSPTACSPTTARGRARPALRLGRGGRAVPPQRARRRRQGRAHPRAGVGARLPTRLPVRY